TAGHEDGGDVEAQRRQQHARRDLVAVRDADQRVRAVGVDHVLDAVGDELAAGQRIEHSSVTHRDTVIDRDGVELHAPATCGVHHTFYPLPHVVKVNVAGHELGEAVGD